MEKTKNTIHYHLPGLFEFYDFYKKFLPLYQEHKEYFYENCKIQSIYGAPADCLWGGGRVGFGDADKIEVFELMEKYKISARLTFSNSLLSKKDLEDKKCNQLCRLFNGSKNSGVIIYSDLLLKYLEENYPNFYYVSTTTKVIRDFEKLKSELDRKDFSYVVPDISLNRDFENLKKLNPSQKEKVEFLCNECCSPHCPDRKICYENVSRKNLGQEIEDHLCKAGQKEGNYSFSRAMKNPSFISLSDIQNIYLPLGFTNFKIEGRSLGSALLLEFILFYMTKAQYHLQVREALYLDSSLDLF
ncbi:MAG: hypothetical protein K5866_03660 [Treponema sp.]|nr:hypothetical protein [Treponema sp.]